MTITMRLILTAALFVPTATFMIGADDDVAVVVNKTNAVDNLTKAQLRKLLLGEQTTWPGGKKVTLILRSPGQADRNAVLRSICGMQEEEFNEHLMKSNFNGDAGGAPKIAQSPLAVRQLVMTTPGAIAFLRVSEINDTVKQVNVEGVAAGKPDYVIKPGK